MITYSLFIDELGSSNPKDERSPCYVLSGCLLPEFRQQDLKNKADQIKFKYWGKTNIVFHSREIGRQAGDFSMLKDEVRKKEFYKDLFNFLSTGFYQMLFIVVDKERAREQGWRQDKVYRETTREIVNSFLRTLLVRGNVRGRIIAESATAEKDIYLQKALSFFLAHGIKDLSVNYAQIQNILTSICFVTKKNLDIEEQIADLLAYGIVCSLQKKSKSRIFPKDSYEERIITIAENKKFMVPPNAGMRKSKVYKTLNPLVILP